MLSRNTSPQVPRSNIPRLQVMSMAATVANLVLGEADGQIDERPGGVLGLHNFRWCVVLPAANEASKSFSTG